MLERLKAAGLGSLPGGGGEILVDRVRKAITRGKVLTDDWLNVHRVWHELGGRSTATMMFGHIETLAERIEHLERLRQLQDETGGFTAFICWTFQPEHTDMADHSAGRLVRVSQDAGRRAGCTSTTSPTFNRAGSRKGSKIGQLGAAFRRQRHGQPDDRRERRRRSRHGALPDADEISDAIRELGYIPRQRNVFYRLSMTTSHAVTRRMSLDALSLTRLELAD